MDSLLKSSIALCWLAVMVIGAWTSVIHAQDSVTSKENLELIKELDDLPQIEDFENESFRTTQRRALLAKVRQLRWTLDLSDEDSIKLAKCLDDLFEDAIVSLNESEVEINCLFNFVQSTELEIAFWEKARGIVPDAKQAGLREIQLDLAAYEERCNASGRLGLVLYLDHFLALSSKQEKQLTDIYAKSWDRIWGGQVLMMNFNRLEDGLDIIHSADPNLIAEVLSEDQLEVYSSIEEFDFSPYGDEISNWTNADFRSRCLKLLDLRLQELIRLCDLDEEQVRRLGVARKGAVASVVNEWIEIQNELDDDNFPQNNRARAWSFTGQTLVQLCERNPIWKKSVEKVLNGEQLETLNNDRLRTLKDCADYYSHSFVVSFVGCAGISMGSKECEELALLIKGLIETPDIRMGTQSLQKVYGLTDEQVKSVMDEKQFRRFNAYFNKWRGTGQAEAVDSVEEDNGVNDD